MRSVFDELTPEPANPFDQFDASQGQSAPNAFAGVYGANAVQGNQPGPAGAPGGNPFDQFDQQGHDGALATAARGAASSATFGLADPIVAGLQSVFGDINPTSNADDVSTRYHENLAALRGVNTADHEAHPVAALAGEVAGGFANPANRLLGSVKTIGDAARMGGKLGLGYGLGDGVANDKDLGGIVDSGIQGAAFGGLTGGALHGVGGKVADALAPRVAPMWQGLQAAAKRHYDALESSGVRVGSDALNALGDSAVDKFGPRMGLDVNPDVALQVYPKAAAALKLLSAYGTEGKMAGETASFHDLDQMRRVVADAVGGAQSSDKYMARQILDHVDNFVDRLGPQHLDTTGLDAARSAVMSATGQKGALARQITDIETNKSGALAARGAAGKGTRDRYIALRDELKGADQLRADALDTFNQEGQQIATGAQDAVSNLKNARQYWKRGVKAKQLQAIIDKAKNNSSMFGQSGYENALRGGFRKLMNNDRGMASFTPDERAAITRVATGGSTFSPTNILRGVGKMSPQGALPLILEGQGIAASLAAGGAGLGAALAIPVAGLAGRAGATALQHGAANRAVDLAALGPGNGAAEAAKLAALLPQFSRKVSPARLAASRGSRQLSQILPALLPALVSQ